MSLNVTPAEEPELHVL